MIDLYAGLLPDPDDPDTFDDRADAVVSYLIGTLVPQANTTEGNINAKEASATSAASTATSAASSASAYASAAQAAVPGLVSTSTTDSVAVPTTAGVDKTFTAIQSGKSWVAGMPIKAARTSAPVASYFTGTVKSYSGTTLVVTSDGGYGVTTGTFTDWTFTYNPSSLSLAAKEDVWLKTPGKLVTAEILLAAAVPQSVAVVSNAITWAVGTSGFDIRVTQAAASLAIGAPNLLYDGMVYTIRHKQDGTGGRTPTLDSIYDLGTRSLSEMNTAAGKTNILSGPYDSDVGKILLGIRPAG